MRSEQKTLVFPAWSDNPYLNLMSLAPRSSGWEFLETAGKTGMLERIASLSRGDVFHLHWTSPLLQREETEAGAWAALAEVQRAVGAAQTRGVRLVWTIHNQLPHELAHREPEIALHRWLADRADAIHVMSPATAAMLADICELPEQRIRQIPHPSYSGVYGAPVGRVEARKRLDVPVDRRTVLFLGQMRPYKGLDTLIAAINELARRGTAPTLLLAGSATPEAEAVINAAMSPEVEVVAKYEFISDQDVGTWFGAADVAVFPYRAILNSGSLHLAASFETPVILPAEPHLVEQFAAETWVRTYSTEDPVQALARTIEDALGSPGDADDFTAFNTAHSPWSISTRYRELLDEVSGSAEAAA